LQSGRVLDGAGDDVSIASPRTAVRGLGEDNTLESMIGGFGAASGKDDFIQLSAEQIGDLAFGEGIRLHELATVRASLEEAYMEVTADSVEYHADMPGQRATTTIGSGV